jgi:hypothetical protein
VPSIASALLDRSETERRLKQIAKPIYVITEDLNSNTVQNMLLDRSRSQRGTDSSGFELTTRGIWRVKHEMRRDLIVKRIKPICLFVYLDLSNI